MPCLYLSRHTPLLWWNLCYVLFLFSFSFFLYFLDVCLKPFCWVFVPAVILLISKRCFLCLECLFSGILLLLREYTPYFLRIPITVFLRTFFDFWIVCFFCLPLFSLFWSFTFMLEVVPLDLSETLKSLLEACVWQGLSHGGLPEVIDGEPAFPLRLSKCQPQ